MAKKKTSSKRKVMRFSIQTYDNAHYKQTEAYTRAVDALFDAATQAITAAAAKGTYDPNKPFAWSDYPSVKAVMQKSVKQLATRMTTVIETGSRKQWLFANEKNNGFVESIMDTSKLSKARLNKMQDRNLDGLAAFQKRKVDGMNLSQRVWKYVDQYKEQLETALDVGLGEGRSAQQLARDVKQNLREPNRLFRRVRDKHGNLQLSKAAKAYHPGRGVYRSSVKNAQRLTRSEINMAYRQSDWERWQTLDFVVGFEIKRSNHDPLCECKVCEKLKGRYPKTFKFVGWHPQCMCYAIPVLSDEDEFDENELGDLKAALNGSTYEHKASRNTVIDVPKGFTEWVGENIAKQDDWASTPYFIRDNFKNGRLADGLAIEPVKVENVVAQMEVQHTPYTALSHTEREKYRSLFGRLDLATEDLQDACRTYGIGDVDAFVDLLVNALGGSGDDVEYWRYDEAVAMRDRLENEVRAAIEAHRVKAEGMIAKLRADADAASVWVNVTRWRGIADNAERMMQEDLRDKYPNLISYVRSTSLQHDFTAEVDAARDKYNKAVADAKAIIAAPNGRDVAELQRLVALQPGRGQSGWEIADMLENAIRAASGGFAILKQYDTNAQVDETFKDINATMQPGERWFENGDLQLHVTYDRGVNGQTDMRGRIELKPERLEYVKSALGKIGQGKADTITFEEADAMATYWHEVTHNRNVLGNMWLTATERRCMELANEFVARHTLPEFYAKLGVSQTPHPEFITNRNSTGYNPMVTNYDHVITRLGLNHDAVLASVRQHLFTAKYNDQAEGLKQGLLDGGLAYIQQPGKKAKAVKRSDLNSLVKLIREQEYSKYDYDTSTYKTKETVIDEWLIAHGFLEK